jgi:hypothetical protein
VRARGFVMPVVILLTLVVGIMAAVLMQRISTQDLTVRRELDNYQSKHFERGVREVVGEWTGSLFGQPLSKMVDEDGHALDLELPDGSSASVYLFDGQGSVLAEPQGLTQEQRHDGAGIIRALHVISGGRPNASWFRPVGPLRVSAAGAPEEVLRAIGMYATGGRGGAGFAAALIDARARASGEDLQQADLDRATSAEEMTPEQKDVVNRLIALKPDVWGVVVEVYSARGDLRARYAGRFTLPGDASRGMSSLQTLGKFLNWERLPLGDESAG